MNKLKHLFFLVVASLLFASCGKTPIEPHLIVSADTLVFKGNDTLSLYVTTDNPERREFYVNIPFEWMDVRPQSGRIAEGDTVELKLISHIYDYMSIKEDFLYLTSSFDEKQVKLIGLPEDYTDYTLPDTLFFPQDINNVVMRINNYGNTTLEYAIAASTDFVSFSPNSGQLPMMQHADISVTIDRENLLMETCPRLYVTIDDKVDTVLLIPEKKLMLPNDVVDAEYAKATDLLVYVAADATLNIYHPDTKTLTSVQLSYTPTCVSVSPDGTKAAVGHDAHVTYVDLIAENVLTTNDISCDALDIVLTNNGWTYVFPNHYGWTHFSCINISTPYAMETLQTGHNIYGGTKGKLHPSGNYIYGADNGLSPADIEKYDIQDGTAQYLYDSPYHGDYYMGGDLWFEENGERLFTRAGTVFKTSETQSMDMIYNGTIPLDGDYRSIAWLDQLDLKREIYLVRQVAGWSNEPGPPFVDIYDSDNLTHKIKIGLEKYAVANGVDYTIYAACPYFVFANSNGTELYVITKANGSGMVHEWAIQTIDME